MLHDASYPLHPLPRSLEVVDFSHDLLAIREGETDDLLTLHKSVEKIRRKPGSTLRDGGTIRPPHQDRDEN